MATAIVSGNLNSNTEMTLMTTLFGIKNCDTIKKARKWLEAEQIDYQFHDYRADGLSAEWLAEIEAKLGWEQLLNKRGTTFRQLSDEQKKNLDRDNAMALLQQYPAMIKRPLLDHKGHLILGFKTTEYEEVFA